MATDVADVREAAPPRVEAPAGRVFWQPRKWTFWAYVGLVVASTVPWFGMFYQQANQVPGWVIAGAVVLNLVVGILLALLIRWLDVYRGVRAPLFAAASYRVLW